MQQFSMQTEINAQTIVSGIVDSVLACFGARIHSVYLGGSFSRSQLTATSDIDMTIVFRGTVSPAEYDQFTALRTGLQQLSPFRLDIWPESEDKLRTRPANASVRASTCLYGDGFMHTVPAQSIEHFAMRYVHKAIHFMSVVRGRPQPNPAPLTYPTPEDTYFGYTDHADFDGVEAFKPGTRILVHMVTSCATARLAIGTKFEATTKQESIAQYAHQIGDEWSDYIQQVYDVVKGQLQYRMPSDADEQAQLRALLNRLPDFENDALAHFRPVILANLQSDDRRRKKLALVALKNIQFRDAEIIRALDSISDLDDMELLHTVKSLVQKFNSD